MGPIVVATSQGRTSDVERGSTAPATDAAGNVPCEPTDAHVLAPAAPTTNADEHRDDDLVNGAHAEEHCAAAEGVGLPSASTASAKRGWEESESTLRRCASRCGSAVQSHVSERGAESSAAGRRELAPCDAEGDNRADYCAGLDKARGANERGAAAGRCDIFRSFGPPLRRRGLGPAGWGGHWGRAQRTSGFGGNPREQTEASSCLRRSGLTEACANRGERPPPRAFAFGPDFRVLP